MKAVQARSHRVRVCVAQKWADPLGVISTVRVLTRNAR